MSNAFVLLILPLSTPAALAQSAPEEPDTGSGSPYRFGSLFKDVKDFATAPLRWDTGEWVYFGGAIAAVAAAHGFDTTVRRDFVVGQTPTLNGKDTHSLSDALPAAVVVGASFFYAWNINSIFYACT